MKYLEDIKVSVIVPIYNVAPYLNKLINSIISQKHRNIEILLIDDGSQDESGKICDSFADLDKRIVVIHESNSGGCAARNKGLEKATGDYLTFIDGDDWVEPDYVEYLLNIAIDNDAELVFSENIFTTRNRNQVESDSIEIWSAEHSVVRMLTDLYIGCWGKLYKTDLVRFNNLNFNVPWGGEGMYFETMAAQYARKVAVGKRKIYTYRLNNSTSCLTDCNVTVGVNSLWNIINIGRVSPVQTSKTKYAVKWHTWKNYNFLLRLILNSNSKDAYAKEYKECIFKIRSMIPYLVFHKGVFPGKFWGLRYKIQMIKQAISPVRAALELTRKQRESLQKDMENMNL